jgi:hypothetical protein
MVSFDRKSKSPGLISDVTSKVKNPYRAYHVLGTHQRKVYIAYHGDVISAL